MKNREKRRCIAIMEKLHPYYQKQERKNMELVDVWYWVLKRVVIIGLLGLTIKGFVCMVWH